MRSTARFVFALLLALSSLTPTLAQDTAFTYQGQLKLDGSLADGSYDFRFTVYDGSDPFVDTELDSHISLGVAVDDGVFTTQIVFDAAIFDGRPLWLQTEVRQTGTVTLYSLSPLQPLTPVPYATFAVNADRVDGLDSTDLVTQDEVPAGTRSGCQICLGWSDGNGSSPSREQCVNLASTSQDPSNFLQLSGDVDSNDRLWLWLQCP